MPSMVMPLRWAAQPQAENLSHGKPKAEKVGGIAARIQGTGFENFVSVLKSFQLDMILSPT